MHYITIIYDGQCPACQAYFEFQRLEEDGITVNFIDARKDSRLVEQCISDGIDLDRDFVLRIGTETYTGSEAMSVLAAIGDHRKFRRRLNYAIFGSRSGARVLYPLLRVGRYSLLRLLGRKRLRA